MNEESQIAVALLHYPVLNRQGETTTTAITSIDVHDLARSCAFYDVAPLYLVHPAAGMRAVVTEMCDHYLHGAGGVRNPDRKRVLASVRCVDSLQTVLDDADYQLWYTSAAAPASRQVAPAALAAMPGKHLIVLGTGWGLDERQLPNANGWLSSIEGVGKVRHLSVRAALAIYLDRLRQT